MYPVGFECFPLPSNDSFSEKHGIIENLRKPLNAIEQLLEIVKIRENHCTPLKNKPSKIIQNHWGFIEDRFFNGFTFLGL